MAATTLREAVLQALTKAANSFFTAQNLTPEQQEQARLNINAMSADTSPSIPTGSLLPFAGIEVPDGYLLCNGAEISRTDYASLFAVIGEKWGAGDGSTTFTLPNFNDRFIEGTTDTSKVGQYLEAGAPNITGTIYSANFGYGAGDSTGAFTSNVPGSYHGAAQHNAMQAVRFSLDSGLSSLTYGQSETVQPYSGYALIIIKE